MLKVSVCMLKRLNEQRKHSECVSERSVSDRFQSRIFRFVFFFIIREFQVKCASGFIVRDSLRSVLSDRLVTAGDQVIERGVHGKRDKERERGGGERQRDRERERERGGGGD